jgi:hypothetical protein
MNVNSSEGRRAWLEMWKGTMGLSMGFPLRTRYQSEIIWDKTFGNVKNNQEIEILQKQDNNYFISGDGHRIL